MDGIVDAIINIFGGVTNTTYGKEILVFLISMMPLLELRGGILAAALLDLSGIKSFIICVIANIIVIPIALFLLEIIFKLLRKIKSLDKLIDKFEKKCLSKRSQLDKYGYLGLFLFVGIPFPGTGAWTGCFLSSLLNMDKKKSFLAALAGVLMAAIIMQTLSFGILKNLF
jgi:uncharacterized membrane protein